MAFTHLWTYRMLDGTYNDFLAEEHVEMLQATKWFKKKVASDFTPRAARPGDDEDDEYLEQLQYQFGGALDDEEDAPVVRACCSRPLWRPSRTACSRLLQYPLSEGACAHAHAPELSIGRRGGRRSVERGRPGPPPSVSSFEQYPRLS
jgi:hypothetical protein